MSPRPRKVTDDEVFGAAARAMAHAGPTELTLAHIAAEAGITAGALVQRFGSKRQLLLSMSSRVTDTARGTMDALRAKHRTPLATLRAYFECFAGMAHTPATLARSFAYLQIDLTDPAFYPHLVAQARATRAAFEGLIREAIASGDLVPRADPVALARLVEVTLGGSLMSWAVYRQGPAAAWLLHDLELALGPYVTPKPRHKTRRKAAGR
jgi:AcrR family transcriptional regulator